MKRVRVTNPGQLHLVNPHGGKKTVKPKKRSTAKKNPTRIIRSKAVARRSNPGTLTQKLTTGVVAALSAAVARKAVNLLPLPASPALNLGAKAGIGLALSYIVEKIPAAAKYGDAVTAGALSIVGNDVMQMFSPDTRTIYVPTPTQAKELQQAAAATQQPLNDIVALGEDYVDMSDVITSQSYYSDFAR